MTANRPVAATRMHWKAIPIGAALLLAGCANPFGDSCGGPSLLGSPGFALFSSRHPTMVDIAAGSTVSIPVCAVRYRFFDDPIELEVSGLSPEISSNVVRIAGSRYSTTLVLTADPGMRISQHHFEVRGISGSHEDSFELFIEQVGDAPAEEPPDPAVALRRVSSWSDWR